MTDKPRIPFNPPEWHGTPVKLGEHWTLTKGKRKAICVLWNHPVGAELRLDVDGDLLQSKASRDYGELLDASDEWRKAFEAKGWQKMTVPTPRCPECDGDVPLEPFNTSLVSKHPDDAIDDPRLERWDNFRCPHCERAYRVNSKTGNVAETRGRS